MDNCLFCKIVKGEVPSYKVYEDEQFFAFLDVRPATKGHTLVVPKKHYQWTYDVPNFGEYWEVTREIGRKLMEVLGVDWMNFLTHGEIPHAHIHILPRSENVETAEVAPKQSPGSKEELQDLAKKISASMQS